MKRQIKFRGYCPDTESWVYGSLISYKNGECYIVEHVDEELSFMVLPESVGQYTGLKDKNGVEIYEGDIIAVEREINFQTEYVHHLAIEWVDYGNGMVGWTQFSPRNRFVVVGNIHDNPELLTK